MTNYCEEFGCAANGNDAFVNAAEKAIKSMQQIVNAICHKCLPRRSATVAAAFGGIVLQNADAFTDVVRL